jgi:hypothetical protein
MQKLVDKLFRRAYIGIIERLERNGKREIGMATLKLKRTTSGRVATVHWAALAAAHRYARLQRNGRIAAERNRLEEEGLVDCIKDPSGRWVDVFGEYSNESA